jgi:Na+/H+ antiporter NhaD/arsenite permease-like protein
MSSLKNYEDYILVAASILAAVADALGAEPRYSLYALIIGAVAKGLMSIISKPRNGSPL